MTLIDDPAKLLQREFPYLYQRMTKFINHGGNIFDVIMDDGTVYRLTVHNDEWNLKLLRKGN